MTLYLSIFSPRFVFFFSYCTLGPMYWRQIFFSFNSLDFESFQRKSQVGIRENTESGTLLTGLYVCLKRKLFFKENCRRVCKNRYLHLHTGTNPQLSWSSIAPSSWTRLALFSTAEDLPLTHAHICVEYVQDSVLFQMYRKLVLPPGAFACALGCGSYSSSGFNWQWCLQGGRVRRNAEV